jgi:hypothetical protein
MQIFQGAKIKHITTLNDENANKPVLPCHEFGPERRIISNSVNIKWNHSEFIADYDCLKTYYLVGGYFLTKLLNLSDLNHPPSFGVTIIDSPETFWNELRLRFMASIDKTEQQWILMTMCVLYHKHCS